MYVRVSGLASESACHNIIITTIFSGIENLFFLQASFNSFFVVCWISVKGDPRATLFQWHLLIPHDKTLPPILSHFCFSSSPKESLSFNQSWPQLRVTVWKQLPILPSASKRATSPFCSTRYFDFKDVSQICQMLKVTDMEHGQIWCLSTGLIWEFKQCFVAFKRGSLVVKPVL